MFGATYYGQSYFAGVEPEPPIIVFGVAGAHQQTSTAVGDQLQHQTTAGARQAIFAYTGASP